MLTVYSKYNGISHEKPFAHLMCAVSNVAVFYDSLISLFPGVLIRYFLNDFEMVPFAAVITDILLLLLSSTVIQGV